MNKNTRFCQDVQAEARRRHVMEMAGAGPLLILMSSSLQELRSLRAEVDLAILDKEAQL